MLAIDTVSRSLLRKPRLHIFNRDTFFVYWGGFWSAVTGCKGMVRNLVCDYLLAESNEPKISSYKFLANVKC